MTLISVAEAARRLAFHEDTVRALIKGGRLPAIWITSPGGRRRVRVRIEDLERLVLDPRLVECGACEGQMPWNTPACPRCGWPNPRATEAGR